MDKEEISQLLTEIKKEIAEQNPATKEEVEQIVEEKLKTLKIELSPEDRQLLIDLFEKMRSLDIWLMTTAVNAMDVRQIAMMVDVTFFIFSPPKKIPSVHRCHWLL